MSFFDEIFNKIEDHRVDAHKGYELAEIIFFTHKCRW